jgi:transposase InsO family protein
MLGVSVSGYYDWKGPPTLRTDAQTRVAGRRDRPGAQGLGWHLRQAAHHRRAALRPRHLPRQGTGRPGYETPWDLRAPETSPAAGCEGREGQLAGPRSQTLHGRWPGPAVDDRHHEHPTRGGKIYCCAVIDAFSRMVVGWSIDSRQTGLLVTNALGMALRRRSPRQAGSSTTTKKRSSPPGSSAGRSLKPAWHRRSVPSVPRSTTPWSRRSGPACRSSY